MSCFVCGVFDQRVQLVDAANCSHTACVGCMRAHIQHQSKWHVPRSQMRCFQEGCLEVLSNSCILVACPELNLKRVPTIASAPAKLDLGSQLRAAVLRRKFGNIPRVCPETGSAPSPACPVCHQQHDVLLANDGCCHAACADCWIADSEKLVPLARERCQVDLHRRCLHPACKIAMSNALWAYIIDQSAVVASFVSTRHAEVARLKRRVKKEELFWSACPYENGPTCPSCHSPRLALLANTCCGTALCEDCWASVVTKEIPYCRENYVSELGVACRGVACSGIVSPSIVAHLECEWKTANNAIADFLKDIRSEMTRLRRAEGQNLVRGSKPHSPGPVCTICCEQRLALLSNPECGHAACEDCWARWACENLGHCRRQKRVDLHCFGEDCRSYVTWAIWQHATTRNNDVSGLDKEFAYRRRLQRNELYPPEVQVDCPRAGCLGLGYGGFDTLMCFVCEHQWRADETGESCDTNVELMLGEAMKKCPACGEYIIKNGGCDHMTCRCKHEFYWSTLLPYRR